MSDEASPKKDFRTAVWAQTGISSWSLQSPYPINLTQKINELEAQRAYWKRMALTDELTEIPNRLALRLLVEGSGEPGAKPVPHPARSEKHQKSIIFIDLDGFKAINDTKGHRAGDLVLKEVARCLAAAIRENDHIFRKGGDEFVILLEGASVDDTNLTVARRIEKMLQDGISVTLDNGEVIIARGSIGVFAFDPELSLAENVAGADVAMYHAKQQNKLAAMRQQLPPLPPPPLPQLPGTQPS